MKDETLTEGVNIEREEQEIADEFNIEYAPDVAKIQVVYGVRFGGRNPNPFMTGQLPPSSLRSSLRLLALSFVRAISFIWLRIRILHSRFHQKRGVCRDFHGRVIPTN